MSSEKLSEDDEWLVDRLRELPGFLRQEALEISRMTAGNIESIMQSAKHSFWMVPIAAIWQRVSSKEAQATVECFRALLGDIEDCRIALSSNHHAVYMAQYLPLFQDLGLLREWKAAIQAYAQLTLQLNHIGPAKKTSFLLATHFPTIRAICGDDAEFMADIALFLQQCDQWLVVHAGTRQHDIPPVIQGRDYQHDDVLTCVNAVSVQRGTPVKARTCPDAEYSHQCTSLGMSDEFATQCTHIFMDGNLLACMKHDYSFNRVTEQPSLLIMRTVYDSFTDSYPAIEGALGAPSLALFQRVKKHGLGALHLESSAGDRLEYVPHRSVRTTNLSYDLEYIDRIRKRRLELEQ